MANDVYTQTYDGLATLVSARAAQRVLDRALEAAGQSADTVSGRHMKKLLLGPVCRELETTLPRNGLRRTLKKLAADLTADLTAEAGDARSRTEVKKPALAPDNSPKLNPVEADEEAPASTFFRAPDAVHKERQGEHQNRNWDKQDDEPEEAFAPSAPETGHETASVAAYSSPSTSLPAAQLPVPTQPAPARAPAASRPASKPAAGRKTFPPLAGAQLEAVVLRFAGLEEVKLVASFGPRGEVTCSRGGGFDLDALARYGLMTLTLLRRSGHVRSYYLAHTLYQLFLLPLGGSTLVVIGTPDLNVGSVFGTLSHLEEEL